MTQPLHEVNSTPSWGGRTLSGTLACTRFNAKTWQEYQEWLRQNKIIYEQTYHRPLKCIYGSPREISHKKIPKQSKITIGRKPNNLLNFQDDQHLSNLHSTITFLDSKFYI